MTAEYNLNWLLHKMFMIRDFDFCKNLIEQQMGRSHNHEYLFFVKVCWSFSLNVTESLLKCLPNWKRTPWDSQFIKRRGWRHKQLSLIVFLLSRQGLILREEGKHQEALKSFQRTIEFDSKNASNYKEIGKTLFVFAASPLSSLFINFPSQQCSAGREIAFKLALPKVPELIRVVDADSLLSFKVPDGEV